MILNDAEIRKLCVDEDGNPLTNAMLNPFCEASKGGGVISYGLTHAGYDLRLDAGEVLLFNHWSDYVIDPKRFKDIEYQDKVFSRLKVISEENTRYVVLPANSYVLGKSYEYIKIPSHLKGRCVGKSSLARSGVLINTTPLEPQWVGHLTIEIANLAPCPMKLYLMEGIAQLEFEILSDEPEVTYADKGGIYQNQIGVTPARVRE